ncbi:virulence factor MviM [Paenibacillus sp. J31TS4]|uniref:Gfo/Idh/MocA family protein n=1 Tax=Paenibacillus sp. J31TS4 TaxID=2807195 RepID=UPI001B2EE8D1|nr:Gfo/Idh/MocA family oxidoreductase [Paenibacillus sp. J31TS4]GIP38868.1 virulence factor MviM [Paenibacillus sp. J31TS4]
MTIRIGIIGLGSIAEKAYLPLLAAHPGVEIAGIMSRRKETVERIGRQYRIGHRYTQLSSLLRRGLDAVFVHTPTETHGEIVKECLRHGVHVYVDKPLSLEIKESLQMTEMADKRGKLLAVGFNRRFAPLYVEAKAWLEEAGGFDQCIAQKHRTRTQHSPARETLYDDLIHMLDLLLWLGCGSHGLSGYFQKDDELGRLLQASGSLSWGGSTGYFSMNRQAGGDLERLELHGGGRSAEVVNLESGVFRDRTGGETNRRFGSWETVLERRGFAGAVEHFLACLERPEACQIRAEQTLPTHFLLEKLVRG